MLLVAVAALLLSGCAAWADTVPVAQRSCVPVVAYDGWLYQQQEDAPATLEVGEPVEGVTYPDCNDTGRAPQPDTPTQAWRAQGYGVDYLATELGPGATPTYRLYKKWVERPSTQAASPHRGSPQGRTPSWSSVSWAPSPSPWSTGVMLVRRRTRAARSTTGS